MAHSPLSAPGLLAEPLIGELSRRHLCSPAQVVLRWNLQRCLVPLPSSVDPGHIVENLSVTGFVLAPDHMAALDSLALRSPQ
jgi:alcohol dehydrogenase (NADP+)